MLPLQPQVQTSQVVHEFHLLQNADYICHNVPKEKLGYIKLDCFLLLTFSTNTKHKSGSGIGQLAVSNMHLKSRNLVMYSMKY
jgi:hypothetical protein